MIPIIEEIVCDKKSALYWEILARVLVQSITSWYLFKKPNRSDQKNNIINNHGDKSMEIAYVHISHLITNHKAILNTSRTSNFLRYIVYITVFNK